MAMDRESKVTSHKFTGTGGESEPISTARYAWQSVHFPASGFVDGNCTFEVYNEASEGFVALGDAVAVVGGQVLPVPLEVNHARLYRLNMSTPQSAGLVFKVVNKT